MKRSSRRRFLAQSAAAFTALTVPAPGLTPQRRSGPRRQLQPDLLRAVAEVVLPSSELKADGITRALANFQLWLESFEPVAEMDHPYLSSSAIRYGPGDPFPRWQAQLEALQLQSERALGRPFVRLAAAERRSLIEQHIAAERAANFPGTGEAQHITIGLMSHFYSSSEANDLCYDAEIGRWKCRGLESAPAKPAARRKG